MLDSYIKEHIMVANEMVKFSTKIEEISKVIYDAVKSRKKILICGNGGSAADAQHFAAELVGRYKKERTAIPAIALTTDTSILTAIANDYGYEEVFARQIEALGEKDDVLVIISTSGNSKNLIKAVEKAKVKKMKIIGLLGKNGGTVKNMCDLEITAPSDNTPRIQEMHGLIIHIICEIIENEVTSD